ncbi:uncharacterized protein [Narcine bancroftii]|uniref:uncharacterized protein isoform X2 n=1 Tax=Narcine bancroftii TaxID=1343680 RepID=UPI003831ED9D
MEPEGDKGQGYQHREAEPKDYDIDAIPRGQQKNLHSSTYKRLSNLNDGEWTTTTESFMSQINLKDDYRLREKKPIMDMKDTMKEFFERTSGCPETNHYNVIPRHHPDHFKIQKKRRKRVPLRVTKCPWICLQRFYSLHSHTESSPNHWQPELQIQISDMVRNPSTPSASPRFPVPISGTPTASWSQSGASLPTTISSSPQLLWFLNSSRQQPATCVPSDAELPHLSATVISILWSSPLLLLLRLG